MIQAGKRVLAGAVLLCLAPHTIAQAPQPDESAEADEPKTEVHELIVVTASRTEQPLRVVPTSTTVIQAREIEKTPADDYGDLLRNVPGINVAQLSARDVQITPRQATTSVATGQLVLHDDRTVYLDFYGFVGWDFIPIDPRQIKQIEVVRGPSSAVWGANAMTGVINLITKAPKEMTGTDVTLGAGELGTVRGGFAHAGVSGRMGFKLSADYFEQDPYERPTGFVPGTSTPYPPFENEGTEQMKIDIRVDYDQSGDTTWSFSTGYGSTSGIFHTGMGPFALDKNTSMSHVKVDWTKRAMQVTFFANIFDGAGENLLTIGPGGLPLSFTVENETYNLDFSNTNVLRESHILTYGANARQVNFDLSMAPNGEDRRELGVYLQDDILLGNKVRWMVGARWDDIDPIDDFFCPRTAVLVSPRPSHTLRLSFGRAYRAPSLINLSLESAILTPILLPTGPYFFPTVTVGNPDLGEERLDAFELGYVGQIGNNTTLQLAAYRNESKDLIDFYAPTAYNSQNPPPGWPLPPFLLDFPPLAGALPSSFSFRNLGEVTQSGFEASVDVHPAGPWSFFVNYSFQDEPETTDIPQDEINKPPEHRFNIGGRYSGRRYYVSGNVNYVDEAFWTDVLDFRYWGPTEDYTQVNLSAGVRLGGGKTILSVVAQNIFDERVQQHVFGDILSRKIVGELRFSF